MAANTFITKLIEECNKGRYIIDQNALKVIRSEDDLSAFHWTLRSIFKDIILETITHMLNDHCKPLLQGYD